MKRISVPMMLVWPVADSKIRNNEEDTHVPMFIGHTFWNSSAGPKGWIQDVFSNLVVCLAEVF